MDTIMITKLKTTWNKYRLQQRTIRELQALSNRDLADLGIFREDIEDLVKGRVN